MSFIKEHYLYAGKIIVTQEPHLVVTVLGSCISVYLYDPITKIGGINHYKPPLWNGIGLASPNYSNIAIDQLIKKITFQGSERGNLIAKVIGSAAIFTISHDTLGLGKKNITVVLYFLANVKIPIVRSLVSGNYGRRLNFNKQTGEAFVRMLKDTYGLTGENH